MYGMLNGRLQAMGFSREPLERETSTLTPILLQLIAQNMSRTRPFVVYSYDDNNPELCHLQLTHVTEPMTPVLCPDPCILAPAWCRRHALPKSCCLPLASIWRGAP